MHAKEMTKIMCPLMIIGTIFGEGRTRTVKLIKE